MQKLTKLFRKSLLISLFISLGFMAQGCEELQNLTNLSEQEVADGLKEALKVGTQNSVSMTHTLDGYYGNPAIRIPFPPEAQNAYNYISSSMPSLKPLLTESVLLMNRAAENASDKAGPIFLSAITSLTIMDAWNILKGQQNAATVYLQNATYSALYTSFKPDIHAALSSVGATTTWNTITSGYNTVAAFSPSLNAINTDLSDYTTNRALTGLFYLIEQEELKIRTDPQARVNDLLKRVFALQ